MSITEYKSASETISVLLCGTSLDSIRIYSAIIMLGFFRPVSTTNLPIEAWISVSGYMRMEPLNRAPETPAYASSDFFAQRASILGELYLLMGKEISAARVSHAGGLEIEIGERRIRANSDGDDLEEIWAVMSDSPDANKDHSWYISLDDSGHVIVKSPN